MVAHYREPDFQVLLRALPEPTVVLTPDLVVRYSNAAFLATTGVCEKDLLGRHLIDEVFPDKPGTAVPGRVRLRESFAAVRCTGVSDAAGVSRYDLPAGGSPQPRARYWSPVNSPISDDEDSVRYIVHRVQDVTAARGFLSALVSTASSMADAADPSGGHHRPMPAAALGFSLDADGELMEQVRELQNVLGVRAVIEQAKGMLMASRRITAEAAFALLRQESQYSNVKIRDLAARHVLMHSAKTPPLRHAPMTNQRRPVR